jgi:chromosome segregation ATPase
LKETNGALRLIVKNDDVESERGVFATLSSEYATMQVLDLTKDAAAVKAERAEALRGSVALDDGTPPADLDAMWNALRQLQAKDNETDVALRQLQAKVEEQDDKLRELHAEIKEQGGVVRSLRAEIALLCEANDKLDAKFTEQDDALFEQALKFVEVRVELLAANDELWAANNKLRVSIDELSAANDDL